MNEHICIQETINWLTNFVIEHTICPFAKREQEQNSIHYCVIETADLTECLTAVVMECLRLDNQPEITTTLLIIPRHFECFEKFLDLLAYAEAILIARGYEGVYQLASFHPDYCFQDTAQDDPSNYTNRSPYPMLHLLRESSIEAALKNVQNPDSIPERNIRYTRQLGSPQLQKILADCFQKT